MLLRCVKLLIAYKWNVIFCANYNSSMKHISKIHGLTLSAWAMAGLCGNQMSEVIHNNTGNYINVFKVTLILYVIAIAINMIVVYAIAYRSRRLRQNERV